MLSRRLLRSYLQDVCIVGFGRSATGQYGGVFKNISNVNLASQVCAGTLSKFSIPASLIETSYTGIYLFSEIGPSPTKQVAAKIGLPPGLNCTYVNKLCASGFKAVLLGIIDVMARQSRLVLTGGMEHMTEALYHLSKEDQKKKVVTTFKCLIEGKLLTEIADDFARREGFTREQQDNFSLESLEKATYAKINKLIKDEIIPVTINGNVVDEDELKDYRDVCKSIRSLVKGGSVTSINTAPFGDGACYIVLCTREEAKNLGLKVYASIVSIGEHENSSKDFITSHHTAMEKALTKGKLALNDIDLFEIAETFALVPLVSIRDLKLDPKKVNIYGGDLAYAHPPGTTGVKMIISLIQALKNEKKEIGMISMPGACGGGSALIIRRE